MLKAMLARARVEGVVYIPLLASCVKELFVIHSDSARQLQTSNQRSKR